MSATGLRQPVLAGVVCASVGFTSSFTVVLGGAVAMGATPRQAASGLLAVTVATGVGILLLAWRYRIPITLAWSTPGAALLISSGAVAGGWPAAVAAFLTVGVLIIVSGLWSGLADLIRRIPRSVAQAMLAGVLLPICLQPVTAAVTRPLAIVPIVGVWLLLLRFAPTWAVPGAFAAAVAVLAVALLRDPDALAGRPLAPVLDVVVPQPTWQALVGVALPLYLVTMAAQNIPGVAVMKTFDFDVPWRSSMTVTGVGTMAAAAAGGHAVNLAAISAAIAAGPGAGPRERRWIAAIAAGVTYLVIAAGSTALAAVMLAGPGGVAETVAGLALLPTLFSAVRDAMTADDGSAHVAGGRLAAGVTFVVASSGIVVAGIGAAFWAIVAGLAVRGWLVAAPVRRGDAG